MLHFKIFIDYSSYLISPVYSEHCFFTRYIRKWPSRCHLIGKTIQTGYIYHNLEHHNSRFPTINDKSRRSASPERVVHVFAAKILWYSRNFGRQKVNEQLIPARVSRKKTTSRAVLPKSRKQISSGGCNMG